MGSTEATQDDELAIADISPLTRRHGIQQKENKFCHQGH